jgi:hypothetical protein
MGREESFWFGHIQQERPLPVAGEQRQATGSHRQIREAIVEVVIGCIACS